MEHGLVFVRHATSLRCRFNIAPDWFLVREDRDVSAPCGPNLSTASYNLQTLLENLIPTRRHKVVTLMMLTCSSSSA